MKEDTGQILIVDKIVNNNIVIAKDFRGREVVAIGKGVGFRKRKNEAVHRSEIMKTYVLLDKVDSGVLTLFEEIQFEVIETSQKIIDYAQEKLNVKFNVNLLMSLSDHINFALIQYRQGNHVPKLVNEEVFIQAHVGGFAPGIIAATHPFLVMMGVNMLMVAPMTELLTRVGSDNVFRPGWILHNISEGGACFAVAARTKDKDMRMAALSAGIGAIVSGVSEPALYGVNLRLRKPMIGLVLGGFIGGSVAGFMGAKAFSMGYSSILGVVIFEKTIAAIIAGVIVSFLVSFIVTFVLFNGKETK